MKLKINNEKLVKKRFIPFYIPFIGKNELKAVKKAILDNSISGNGFLGRQLEEEFKKYTGSKYAFFTNSCTSAIEIALMSLGVGSGDEVIIPSFSFVSIANAVVRTGAKLIFVDINEDTFNVEPSLVRKAVTKKTKVVIPVHYAGQSCRMDELLSIRQRFDLKIVEDAAQAAGSFYKGMHLGTIGDIGCLSLHGTKNITCGEGGFFLTNNRKIAGIADIIREKGTNRSLFLRGKIDKYSWLSLGSSYVQSDILAAIAVEQLKRIDWINKRRKANAEYLNSKLKRFNHVIKLPKVLGGADTNWHIYAVVLRDSKKRDHFIKTLYKMGVECHSHFVPLHTSLFARKYLGYKRGNCPVTEKVCDSLVRLPIYPQLSKYELEYMLEAIEKALLRI